MRYVLLCRRAGVSVIPVMNSVISGKAENVQQEENEMIKKLPESEGPFLGFEVTGKVSLEEEKEWIEKVQSVVDEHGKISVLVILDEKAGWGVEAGIEDLKWFMTHMKQLNKIAVVSESNIWKWLVNLDSPFAKMVGIGEKHFEPSKIKEAWSWIKE